MKRKNDGLPKKNKNRIEEIKNKCCDRVVLTESEADCSFNTEVKPRPKGDPYTNIIKHYNNLYKSKGLHPGKLWCFLCTIEKDDTSFNKSNYKTLDTAYSKSGKLMKDKVAVFQYIGLTSIIKPN